MLDLLKTAANLAASILSVAFRKQAQKEHVPDPSYFPEHEKKSGGPPFDDQGHAILFLPTKTRLPYDTIEPRLLENKETAHFVKGLGLTTPSLKDEIYNKILPRYRGGERVYGLKTHFRKFFQYYQECRAETGPFLEELRQRDLLLYRTASGCGWGGSECA